MRARARNEGKRKKGRSNEAIGHVIREAPRTDMTRIRAIMRDNRERYGKRSNVRAWKDIESRGFLWRSTSGASFRNEFSEIFSRNLTARNSAPPRKNLFHLRFSFPRFVRSSDLEAVIASKPVDEFQSRPALVVGKSSRHYIFALEYNRFGEFTLAKSPLSLLALSLSFAFGRERIVAPAAVINICRQLPSRRPL